MVSSQAVLASESLVVTESLRDGAFFFLHCVYNCRYMAKAANATTTAYSSSEYWTVDKLKNWDRNPRSIKGERFEELKTRLKRQGQIKPLLVTQDGTVIGGNMRLRAMKDLGITEVWVSVTDATTDKEIFDLALTDNEEFGYYEKEQVAELAMELGLDPIELKSYALSLGEPTTLDLVVDELGPEVETVEDEAPEVSDEPPVSKLGEIYQLGRHRVMCGDSTEFDQVDTLLQGNRAEMCFTDPPYGVNYEGGHFHSGDVNIKRKREKLAQDDSTQIYSDVVPVIAKYTDGPVYTFYAGTKPTDLYIAVEAVGEIHALLIWHKTNATYAAMNAQYKQRHEPFLYWKPKGSTLRWCGATTEATIWELTKDGRNDMHPTQKPVHLAAKAIQNHNAKTVLDLFLGSGSTLIACEQTDRTCYGMELDPKYVDVIRKRYWTFVNGDEEGWEAGTPAVEVAHAVAA